MQVRKESGGCHNFMVMVLSGWKKLEGRRHRPVRYFGRHILSSSTYCYQAYIIGPSTEVLCTDFTERSTKLLRTPKNNSESELSHLRTRFNRLRNEIWWRGISDIIEKEPHQLTKYLRASARLVSITRDNHPSERSEKSFSTHINQLAE